MVTPPLCIIQARMDSSRLAKKMLLLVNDRPVIWWAWWSAMTLFGQANVVIACPDSDLGYFRGAVPRCQLSGWVGPEEDVLGRLRIVAHTYRDHPASEIIRVTPDDWPIDRLREVFTLGWLDRMHETITDPEYREHIGKLLPPRVELNTEADYLAILDRPLVSV